MTKLAYLECPTGIAGDMCLGALVDAGVSLDYLIEKLAGLGIASEYSLRAEKVRRQGQQATKVYVDLTAGSGDRSHHHLPEAAGSHKHSHHQPEAPSSGDRSHCHHAPHRHLPEIEQLILGAGLPARAQAWSLQVFRHLAEAEAAVHGIPPEQVHFHEVGATDAIVDIVGTCLGLDWLGIDQLYCSPMPTGGGTIKAAHGILPVPAPAVLKLWQSRQVPVYSNGMERELCTPTGVAIATALASGFGALPPLQLQQVGLGAGTKDLPIANILRLWIGTAAVPAAADAIAAADNLETIAVLETQVDDLSPQAIGYTLERLLAAGALDAYTQPIGMKKSRPGMAIAVICLPEQIDACEAVLFRETSTLGVRRRLQQRRILAREIQSVDTDYGSVRIKVAWSGQTRDKNITNVQPEYEDCAALARQHNLPWRQVRDAALHSWYLQHPR